jgi:hypothetical protein
MTFTYLLDAAEFSDAAMEVEREYASVDCKATDQALRRDVDIPRTSQSD